MVRSLPPLNWVRAFEAAARHESFSMAADELGVSAGAVSQKVKALEQRLDTILFERRPRGVFLTDAGRRYRDDLVPALDGIAAATSRVAAGAGHSRLRVSVLPAIAERWLTPRLARFGERFPDIAVEVSADAELPDLASTPVDLAVHYEVAAGHGLAVLPLFRGMMAPVCSPAFARDNGLNEPADLLRCRLLYDTHWADDWTRWFEAAGLPSDGGQRESGFTLYSMAVEAACEGLGAVVGHQPLVARELAAGRLVEPFDLRIPASRGYAIIVPRWSSGKPGVSDFVDWLRDEAS